MKYLRSFQDEAAYITAKGGQDFYRPCVSLIKDGMSLMYDPISTAYTFNPRYLFSDLTTGAELVSGKTVIGVEVIPAAHMTDGKSRWVSVKNMSKAEGEVEIGSTATGNDNDNPAAGICWGKTNDDVPGLDTLNSGAFGLRKDGEKTEENPLGLVNELSTAAQSNVILPTDYDKNTNSYYPFVDNSFIYPFSGPPTVYGPHPFNNDGTPNELYSGSGQAGKAIRDLNGAANTNILVTREGVPSYNTGEALNNDVSGINHPAAVACHRFTSGVQSLAGQWYLPSVGELGYLWANVNKINTKIAAVGTDGVKIGVLNDESSPVDSLGRRLWSSSECSSGNAWYLYTDYGYLYYGSKDSSYTRRRVRAFLAY